MEDGLVPPGVSVEAFEQRDPSVAVWDVEGYEAEEDVVGILFYNGRIDRGTPI
jgi:hypothetical protein